MTKTLVNHRTAQALPAVYSAVSIISEAIASIPIKVYQGDIEAPDSVVANQLANPSWQTSFEFIEALARSALLTGNGYAWSANGALEVLHPDQVQVDVLQRPVDGIRFKYLVSDRFGKQHTVLPLGRSTH